MDQSSASFTRQEGRYRESEASAVNLIVVNSFVVEYVFTVLVAHVAPRLRFLLRHNWTACEWGP